MYQKMYQKMYIYFVYFFCILKNCFYICISKFVQTMPKSNFDILLIKFWRKKIMAQIEKLNSNNVVITTKANEQINLNASNGKINLNELLQIGNDVIKKNNSNFGATIYNNELFIDCKNDKQKKHLRIKLRRKLYNFFEYFETIQNDKNAIEQLKKQWQQYAKIVYKNANNIIDSNAKNEHLNLAQKFLNAMNK